MGIGDSAEDIAACFESWEDFVSVDYVDLKCIAAVTITQRPQILRHIKLFKHGLWPEPSLDEYQKRFGPQEDIYFKFGQAFDSPKFLWTAILKPLLQAVTPQIHRDVCEGLLFCTMMSFWITTKIFHSKA